MAARTKQARQNGGRQSMAPVTVWARYERLKRELTATAQTVAEYDAACRRAAELAGV